MRVNLYKIVRASVNRTVNVSAVLLEEGSEVAGAAAPSFANNPALLRNKAGLLPNNAGLLCG